MSFALPSPPELVLVFVFFCLFHYRLLLLRISYYHLIESLYALHRIM